MTQSAVSRQLAGLETGLQVKLFRRHKQRLYLTDNGRHYFEEIQEILLKLHSAGQRARGKINGRLRLGIEPALASRWLLPSFADLKHLHPELDIELMTDTEKLYRSPDSYDLGILYGFGDWPDLQAEPLKEDSLLAVCSPELLRQYGKIEARSDILRYPLLHDTSTPSSSGTWLKAAGLKQAEIDAVSGSRLENFSLIAQVAEQGLGLAVLPDYFVAAQLKAGSLVLACEEPLASAESYFVVLPQNSQNDLGVLAVKQWLQGL